MSLARAARVVLAALLGCAAGFEGRLARACTCGIPSSGSAALAPSSSVATVFEGRLERVVDVGPRSWSEMGGAGVPTVRFDFAVSRWWKRDPGAVTSVHGVRDMYAGCGKGLLMAGVSYLVYASASPTAALAPFVDGPCSATRAIGEPGATVDLETLGPGRAPQGRGMPPPTAEGRSGGCAMGAPAGGSDASLGWSGVALFLLGVVDRLRRRRRRRRA